MIRRSLELLAASLLGGVLLSRWIGGDAWTLLGALAGAVVWVVWDNARATRVLNWLDQGQVARSPDVATVWGDVVEKARRGLRNMERKAKKSETRLEEFLAAIQASPNGVVLLDKAGTIEWCNLTAAEHLGFDPKRDLGQYIRNLVRDPVFSEYLKNGDFGESVEIDGRQADPSHPHKISIQIHPYRKNRKLLLTRDVTALLLADAMRRDFVANVSHEIRTPLTVLSGFVETMINLPISDVDRQRYLGLMAQQADRMQTLVSDLLTLSRLEGSPMPGSAEWVPCADLLAQVVDEARGLSNTLPEGSHHIVVEGSPDVHIAGARPELHSAMSNLLNNAANATTTPLEIRLSWCTDNICIDIRDLTIEMQSYEAKQRDGIARLVISGWRGLKVQHSIVDGIIPEAVFEELKAEIGKEAMAELNLFVMSLGAIDGVERGNSDSPPGSEPDQTGSPQPSGASESSDGNSTSEAGESPSSSNTASTPGSGSDETTAPSSNSTTDATGASPTSGSSPTDAL